MHHFFPCHYTIYYSPHTHTSLSTSRIQHAQKISILPFTKLPNSIKPPNFYFSQNIYILPTHFLILIIIPNKIFLLHLPFNLLSFYVNSPNTSLLYFFCTLGTISSSDLLTLLLMFSPLYSLYFLLSLLLTILVPHTNQEISKNVSPLSPLSLIFHMCNRLPFSITLSLYFFQQSILPNSLSLNTINSAPIQGYFDHLFLFLPPIHIYVQLLFTFSLL